MVFEELLETYVEERGLDREQVFEVEGPSGLHGRRQPECLHSPPRSRILAGMADRASVSVAFAFFFHPRQVAKLF